MSNEDTPAPKNSTIQGLEANSTMARAYLLMAHHRSPNLPVTSDDQVVGVICERDIETLLRSYGTQREPGSLKVANYMRSPVKTVESNVELADIARIMLDERVNAIIVKRAGEVVGAFTKDDLLEVLAELVKDHPQSLVESLRVVSSLHSSRRPTEH